MARRKEDPRKPNALDVAVGRNVLIWRLHRGLSQSQLADRLGITFQQVQKYEAGSNRVPTGRLAKMATILRVTMDALFHGTAAADPSQPLISDSRSLRLAQAFAAIKNNKARLSLVNMVEKIAEAVAHKRKKRRRRKS